MILQVFNVTSVTSSVIYSCINSYGVSPSEKVSPETMVGPGQWQSQPGHYDFAQLTWGQKWGIHI